MNCTFDRNSAFEGGNAFLTNGRLVTFRSCVFSSAASGGGLAGETGAQASIESCDVWGNAGGDYLNGLAPGPGCLSGDPLYCGSDAQDPYTIRNTSCCVGAGAEGTDIGARGVGCFEQDGVLFYDNWSDQDDTGWNREIEGDGSISIASGSYRHSAGSGLGFTRSIASALDAGDFEYDVSVIPRSGSGHIDLFLRWRSGDEHYKIAFDSWNGRLFRRRGGSDSLLAVFPCAMFDMLRYDFRAEAVGSLIQVWRRQPGGDFVSILSYDDADPIRRGSIGVGTERSFETASFDDVLVMDRTDPAAAPRATEPAMSLVAPPSPNPFSAWTSVHLRLARPSRVRVDVFDAAGARVRGLVDAVLPAGTHVVRWDGRSDRGLSVGSGVYFLRAQAGALREGRSVVLMRR